MDQDKYVKQVAEVMQDIEPMPIVSNIRDLWLAIAGLQLAGRHPGISPFMMTAFHRITKEWIDAIAEHHPEAKDLMEMGWQPEHDVDDDGVNVKEIHQAWTIYGLNPDGRVSDEMFAMLHRPQDWGDPKYTYRRFVFQQWNEDESEHIIYTCHAWTDVPCTPHEMTEMFSSLILKPMMPGTAPQLCGKGFLHDEDFWLEEWGDRPPVFEDSEDYYA